MKNHWIITKDFIDGGKSEGISSVDFPKDIDPNSLPIQFRLYDDDRNLYYEGRMMEEDFDPLDDFGLGNSGCTELRTLNKGVWESL